MKLRPVTHAIYEQLRLRFGRSHYYNAEFLARESGYNVGSVLFAIRELKSVDKVHVRTVGKARKVEVRAKSAAPLVSPKSDRHCGYCFGDLGERKAVCVGCLPYDPAGRYEMGELGKYVDECIAMKEKLLAEREAQGLPLFLESGERNYRRGL